MPHAERVNPTAAATRECQLMEDRMDGRFLTALVLDGTPVGHEVGRHLELVSIGADDLADGRKALAFIPALKLQHRRIKHDAITDGHARQRCPFAVANLTKTTLLATLDMLSRNDATPILPHVHLPF